MQELNESEYLEPKSTPPELGAIFSGVGAGAGTIGTLNSVAEPEPGTECLPGAGAGAVQNFSSSGAGKREICEYSPVIVLNNLKMKANKTQSRDILPGETVGVALIF